MRHLTASFCGIFIAAYLTACGSAEPDISVPHNWTLDSKRSGITYITIKNSDLPEINTFRQFDGRVSSAGQALFTVYLDSVDTNNEIRDPRMREHLFKTDQFPTASASAQLDMKTLHSLPVGSRHTENLELTLDINGIKETREFYVMVTRLSGDKVLVENKAPLLLDASDFGLTAGLAKLQELAGLDAITPVVPVTFSLVFKKAE
jgi:polyisoprenoid-binding protein YceI